MVDADPSEWLRRRVWYTGLVPMGFVQPNTWLQRRLRYLDDGGMTPPPSRSGAGPVVFGDFASAVEEILRSEGGFANHPSDPGGATNMGITKAVLEAYRQRPVTVDEVRNLSRAEAIAIYRRDYWMPVSGSSLPAAVALVVFDGAVNSGVRQSSKWLQRALGVRADGKIGVKTLTAAVAADPTEVVRRILAQREAFLRRLSTWDTFGDGWTARLTRLNESAASLPT